MNATDSGARLTVADLSVAYDGVPALESVSIEVPPGAFVGVLGANGAGKSTLLKAISGLVRPASGTIQLDGADLAKVAAHRIPGLGVAHVPERRRVFPSLTVLDNLRLGGYGRRNRDGPLQEIFELFPRLAERRAQQAGSLSGGEQQMLAIGRALMLRPRLLMLDEPSLGLAPAVVDDVFDRLTEIHRELGASVLLIEQNAMQALEVIDSAVVVTSGAVSFRGTRKELESSDYLKDAYLGLKTAGREAPGGTT